MDTTVCLVSLLWSPFTVQPGQRSVVSCLYQHRHNGNSWAAYRVHEKQQATEWRDEGAMEEGSVPRLGCYLSGHCRSVLRPSQQYPGGSAAAEVKKTRKYSDIVSGVDFSPFAIETSEVWGEHALDLVTEIGRRIAAVTHDPRTFERNQRRRLFNRNKPGISAAAAKAQISRYQVWSVGECRLRTVTKVWWFLKERSWITRDDGNIEFGSSEVRLLSHWIRSNLRRLSSRGSNYKLYYRALFNDLLTYHF